MCMELSAAGLVTGLVTTQRMSSSLLFLPEEHDVLPQLLHRALCLYVCLCIKAGGEGVYNTQLVQGFCMGLQPLVTASHCLCTL